MGIPDRSAAHIMGRPWESESQQTQALRDQLARLRLTSEEYIIQEREERAIE